MLLLTCAVGGGCLCGGMTAVDCYNNIFDDLVPSVTHYTACTCETFLSFVHVNLYDKNKVYNVAAGCLKRQIYKYEAFKRNLSFTPIMSGGVISTINNDKPDISG